MENNQSDCKDCDKKDNDSQNHQYKNEGDEVYSIDEIKIEEIGIDGICGVYWDSIIPFTLMTI